MTVRVFDDDDDDDDDDIEYDAADNRGEGQGKERRNVMSLQTLLSTPPHPIPRVYKAPNMGLRKFGDYNIELTELQFTDLR